MSDEQPKPIHGWQWTLLVAFLTFFGVFLYMMIGPLREWATFGVVYTPAGLADLAQAGAWAIGAMLAALGVDVPAFVARFSRRP